MSGNSDSPGTGIGRIRTILRDAVIFVAVLAGFVVLLMVTQWVFEAATYTLESGHGGAECAGDCPTPEALPAIVTGMAVLAVLVAAGWTIYGLHTRSDSDEE